MSVLKKFVSQKWNEMWSLNVSASLVQRPSWCKVLHTKCMEVKDLVPFLVELTAEGSSCQTVVSVVT